MCCVLCEVCCVRGAATCRTSGSCLCPQHCLCDRHISKVGPKKTGLMQQIGYNKQAGHACQCVCLACDGGGVDHARKEGRIWAEDISRGTPARAHYKRHTSHATRHTSHITRHTSHVIRHTSHVIRHTSHVTRHTSHVIRHTSYVTRHSLQPCPETLQ